MSVESDLYQWLTEQPELTAIVGENVFNTTLPDNPDRHGFFPALLFNHQSAEHLVVMGDRNSAGVVNMTVQFDAVGRDLSEVLAITDALWQVLHGRCGPFGERTLMNALVTEAGEQDLSLATDDGRWLYRRQVDYTLVLNEAKPEQANPDLSYVGDCDCSESNFDGLLLE